MPRAFAHAIIRLLRVFRREPAEFARVDECSVGGRRFRHRVGGRRLAVGGHDHPHGQIELPRELEVALVVRRHGHDGTRAVLAKNEIRDPDRNRLPGERVDRAESRVEALLLDVAADARRAILQPELLRLLLEAGGIRRPFGKARHERMLRPEQHEGGAEDRVDACGEYLDGIGTRVSRFGIRPGLRLQRELHARTLRPADPVPLHRQNLLGPGREPGRRLEELVSVRGDPEEPLLEVARFDRRAAAPAAAVHDLLVGENGVVHRTPVHRGLAPVGEPLLEHADEEPLVPLVILGIARGDLALPRVADAQALELALHVRDVAAGRDLGMNPALDGRVLGRQAEGVPAKGMEDVVAAHPLRAGDDVADDVVPHVPDVSMSRGIGEHLETVELRPRRVDAHLEGTRVGPSLLPLLVEVLRMVIGHGMVSRL